MFFTNLGIMDDVEKMEINEGRNVTEVLTAVSEGSNEVGIVYATDAASMGDSVEIIAEAPEDESGYTCSLSYWSDQERKCR